MSPNLKETFKELDVNDKKNVISRELILIGEFVKKMKEHYDLDADFDIKNYDVNTETNEDDYLLFIYEDIFEIEKQLISVLSRME
ncbi:MAG: hypothetical protein IJB21_05860 [Bacilli bacterium]|nr:hypothetical protein [Bacilli bacterium]